MTQKRKIDFVGIGGPKCGSSWVAKCLGEHPNIVFAPEKEVNYFNEVSEDLPDELQISNFHKGEDWYLSRFTKPEKGQLLGEFSMYMLNKSSAQRIYEYNPSIKLVVALRDPVKVVYSRHWSLLTTIEPNIPKDFNEAIKQGHHLYVGEHYRNLKPYFDLFPCENIHVIFFEDIKSKPENVVKSLYDFLGLDINFKPSVLTTRVNSTAMTRSENLRKILQKAFLLLKALTSNKVYQNLRANQYLSNIYRKLNVKNSMYPPIDVKTAQGLRKYFYEDVSNLEILLSKDLSRWKN